MFFNNNNNRIIAIILVLMIICTVFAGATVSASAVDLVLTPTVIACVGAVLCAAGFTFSNADEMSALVQKVWDYVPDSVKSLMVGYGQKYLDNLNSGKPFILTLSEPIVSALSSWFADTVVDNKVTVSYGSFPTDLSISQSDLWKESNYFGYWNTAYFEYPSNGGILIGSIGDYPLYLGYVTESGNGYGWYNKWAHICFYSEWFKDFYSSYSSSLDSSNSYYFVYKNSLSHGFLPMWFYSLFDSSSSLSRSFRLSFSSSSVTFYKYDDDVLSESYPYSYIYSSVSLSTLFSLLLGQGYTGDIVNNSDYAPTSTSDNALTKDTAVYVPNSVYQDGALSSAGVESMTTAGVRDTAGAETSSQTGLLSSIWEWLKSILDALTSGFSSVLEWLKSMLNSLVSAISGVASAVIEGVKSLFYPEGFTWDSFISEVQSLAPTTNVDFRSYATEIEIPDVTMTTKYGTHTVVDNSPIRDNIATIRKYLGAFLTALLVIFNANMVMKFLGMTSFSITDSRVNHETVDNSYKAIDKKMGKKGGR